MKLIAQYREWNRYAYLSRFERRLNRALWALLIACVTFAACQHVLLANVPEVFGTGARWGELFYDLSIAYVGAFVFYLLNIRLPLRRDRRNVYQSLGVPVSQIVSEAVQLMAHLHGAADKSRHRENTLENIGDTCSRLRLSSEVPSYGVPDPSGIRKATVAELLHDSKERTRRFSAELLGFTQYLASELVDYVIAIEHRGYFELFEHVSRTAGDGSRLSDMRWLTSHLFDYLQLVDRVDRYNHEWGSAFLFEPTFLLSGTRQGSDARPLQRRASPD